MSKAKELLYTVGIESLFIAFMENGKDTRDELPTYEPEVYRMDNIVTIGIAGNPSQISKWASNKLFVSATKNSRFTLNLTHVALPQEVKDKMKGLTHQKGVAFERGGVVEYPYFALGFIAPLSDGSRIARWYPKCQMTITEETFQTQQEETEVQDITNVFEATPLLFNDVTVADFSEVRDSAIGITAEDFMKRVITDESQLELLTSNGGSTGGGTDE